MKGFILVAHGSRRAAANEEIAAFARSLAEGMDDKFAVIGHGFWELAEPSLEQAIDHQVSSGASDIRLFPYFLARGKHVVTDLPSVLEQKREQYPQLSITLLPHLGALPGFADWLGRQL